MKTIGVIGAMEEEISALKSKLDIVSAKNAAGIELYIGKMHGKNVVVARSGIGKVNAAVCAQVLIDLYGVDCIVNVGVAGAIHSALDICDVVISSDTVQHDVYAASMEQGGFKRGAIPRMPVSFFAADDSLIDAAKRSAAALAADRKTMVGRVASGDIFVSSSDEKLSIWESFEALCVEMEGAAIGHVCYLNKMPFVVIRSISDKASDTAGMDFDAFMPIAAAQSGSIVEGIVKLI